MDNTHLLCQINDIVAHGSKLSLRVQRMLNKGRISQIREHGQLSLKRHLTILAKLNTYLTKRGGGKTSSQLALLMDGGFK